MWCNFCAFNGVMPGGHRAVCETVFSALCISCRGAIRTCPRKKRWRAPAFLGSGVPILADCERCFGSSGRIHLALCRANRALRIGRKSRTSTGTGPHCGKWQGRPELTRCPDASRPRSDRPLRGPVRALHRGQGYRRAACGGAKCHFGKLARCGLEHPDPLACIWSDVGARAVQNAICRRRCISLSRNTLIAKTTFLVLLTVAAVLNGGLDLLTPHVFAFGWQREVNSDVARWFVQSRIWVARRCGFSRSSIVPGCVAPTTGIAFGPCV